MPRTLKQLRANAVRNRNRQRYREERKMNVRVGSSFWQRVIEDYDREIRRKKERCFWCEAMDEAVKDPKKYNDVFVFLARVRNYCPECGIERKE